MFFAISLHTVRYVWCMKIEARLGGFPFTFSILAPLFYSYKRSFRKGTKQLLTEEAECDSIKVVE